MKKTVDFIRSFFISFEFIVALGMVLLLCSKNPPIDFLTNRISLTVDILKYFAIIPIAILGLFIKEIWPLIFPEFDKKRILQRWPGYYKLKSRIAVAVIYSCLFAISGSASWFCNLQQNVKITMILIIGSIIGSCIVYLSVFMAKIRINELFLQNER